MKKLTLNKTVVAHLNNPNQILGGDDKQTWSLDGNGNHKKTCIEDTCGGPVSNDCDSENCHGESYDSKCWWTIYPNFC